MGRVFSLLALTALSCCHLVSSQPRLTCDERPDAIDLAPDDNFYFFVGAYVYFIHKDTGRQSSSWPITDFFAQVQWPVIAAASIGPQNSRMFVVDSAYPNNLKIYNFQTGIPRQPIAAMPLLTFFPQAPQPLMAMASTYIDHQQIMLFGLVNGERRVVIGIFDAATSTVNNFKVFSETHKNFGNTDITAATTFRYPNNGPEILYYFNATTVALATFNPTVAGHPPARLATCPLWVPPVLNSFCRCEPTTPSYLATTTPIPNVPPPVPAMTCNEVPDAVDLAPDDNYYYFVGAYFYTVHKITNVVTAPQLITSVFPTVQYPVLAAFSTDFPDARMIIIDSTPPSQNIKRFQFAAAGSVPASAPRPLISTGYLNQDFPGPANGPYAFGAGILQLVTAAVMVGGEVTLFGRLVTGQEAYFVYKFDMNTRAFTWLTFNDQPQEWLRDVKAATTVYVPNEGVSGYYTYSHSNSVSYGKQRAAVISGPVPTASCPSWMPSVVSPTCCLRQQIPTTPLTTPTTSPSTTPTSTSTTTQTTTPSTTPTTTPTTTPITTPTTTQLTTQTTTPTTTTSSSFSTILSTTRLTTTSSSSTTTAGISTASTLTTPPILFPITRPQSTQTSMTTTTTSTTMPSTPAGKPQANCSNPPQGSACGGCCCDSTVVVQGWYAIPSSAAKTIMLHAPAKSGRHCLRMCQSVDSRCRLVSYDLYTLECVGFTGVSRPVFKRNVDAVLLASTDKALYPLDKATSCWNDGVQSAGETFNVEYAGNCHVCQSLCLAHPGCVQAELSGTTCAMHVCPTTSDGSNG